MLAALAMQVAVLTVGGETAGDATAALERALEQRGVAVLHDAAEAARVAPGVKPDDLAELGRARADIQRARRHHLLVELDAANEALDRAIAIFERNRRIAGVSDELADAWLLRGMVRFHARNVEAAREAFARAKALGGARRLGQQEVHPDIARLYSETAPAELPKGDAESNGAAPVPKPLSAEEVCDRLDLDGAWLVTAARRKNGLVLSAARFDARTRRFTGAEVGRDADALAQSLLAAAALGTSVPTLAVPLDPPPPRFWRRGWFWAVVGGAVVVTGASVWAAEAARDTHTSVVAPGGTFQ